MYLVSCMDIIITPATSLFVLANLLHKPTIAIFGNEDLNVYAKYFSECIPIQRRHEIHGERWNKCPCWRSDICQINNSNTSPACLQDITVSEVMQAIEKLINKIG